ncbi:hypothetical protein [Acaricomes phytoseiuli]|uniref:hypothetical protein n=1 Tax=Acaricomes phytoseiuli TaxID=291968 RepID=UPI00316ADEA6
MTYGWEHIALPLDDFNASDLEHLSTGASAASGEPGFFDIDFELVEPANSYLALPRFRKGFLWVNETLLGRYWSRGPQKTLYAPKGMFMQGANRVSILELEESGETLEFKPSAELG